MHQGLLRDHGSRASASQLQRDGMSRPCQDMTEQDLNHQFGAAQGSGTSKAWPKWRKKIAQLVALIKAKDVA